MDPARLPLTTTTIHASCVAIGDRGVLIEGPSGSGKSDLALRLIDRGATLVSDDYTLLSAEQGHVFAEAPATIAGKLEVRGLGIVAMERRGPIAIALTVSLGGQSVRFPEPDEITLLGAAIPRFRFDAHEPSAPIKVELALAGCLTS